MCDETECSVLGWSENKNIWVRAVKQNKKKKNGKYWFIIFIVYPNATYLPTYLLTYYYLPQNLDTMKPVQEEILREISIECSIEI